MNCYRVNIMEIVPGLGHLNPKWSDFVFFGCDPPI